MTLKKKLLTLNMIVKNEEALLPRCLKTIKDFVDEIIIIDTGSTDNTKGIAESFGATVHDFEWCDDFGAARNFALSKVTTPWVLWLDADDMVQNPEIIRGLLASAHKARQNHIWSLYQQDKVSYQRRMQLFRAKEFRWEGCVHENPIARDRANADGRLSDLVVLHAKPGERNPKAARQYLDILESKDPENWYGIAESYRYLAAHPGDPVKAEEYKGNADECYWRAYNYPGATPETQYACLVNMVQLNLQKKDQKWFELGIKYAQMGVGLYPDRAECWALLAQCWLVMKQFHKATEAAEQALTCPLPDDAIGMVYAPYYKDIPEKILAKIKEYVEAKRKPLIMTPDHFRNSA